MSARIIASLAVAILLASTGSAQTVRFDTNVGSFDMVLNPTGNVNLQGHVDNLLAYVNSGRYEFSVIHDLGEVTDGGKADIVMNLGSAVTDSESMTTGFSNLPSIAAFDPLVVDADGDGTIDFDRSGLTNFRGTVSMAPENIDPTSSTSRFFVNLTDNPEIDLGVGGFGDLIPFAEIKDMATLDLIQALDAQSLPGIDTPIVGDNRWVIVERAFVLDDAPVAAIAAILEGETEVFSPLAASAELAIGSDTSSSQPVFASLQAGVVPEPSTLLLAAAALLGVSASYRRRVCREGYARR